VGLNPSFWEGKHVLVTGHTGFKGAWLTLILRDLGANVVGLSLPPEYPQSLYADIDASELLFGEHFHDIRDFAGVVNIISESRPDYVFHLAAQAYVRKSYKKPLETIATNVLGTGNVLIAALAQKSVIGVTIATTDKVYENLGTQTSFKESDRLGGSDPYSASKAATELIVSSLTSASNQHGTAVTTVRAGNVIGGGDWGEDRLIPDIVRAYKAGKSLSIRNPNATRPWQHVLDCLYGYLLTAELHFKKSEDVPKSLNFGPQDSMSVIDLVKNFEKEFNQGIAQEFVSSPMPESNWLALDAGFAYSKLGWKPSFSQLNAVSQTAKWYSKFLQGESARALMQNEIADYKVGKW
jgi:CDP-glucose 4,6-dehydratase